jgi:hypothetical protein
MRISVAAVLQNISSRQHAIFDKSRRRACLNAHLCRAIRVWLEANMA